MSKFIIGKVINGDVQFTFDRGFNSLPLAIKERTKINDQRERQDNSRPFAIITKGGDILYEK